MAASTEVDGNAAAAPTDLLPPDAIAVGTMLTPEQRRKEDDEIAAALVRGALSVQGASGFDSPPAISVRGAPSIFSYDNDLSESSSLKSSVVDHVYENGMRYHGFRAGRYPFPNDDVEQNRDDMKHTMARMLCQDAYFYSPIEDALEAGGEVLDLGTGTGIWAIELADKYPEARITGIDLSPIQPNFVPENARFFVDDFEMEWVDPENTYDFIHIRHTLHCVRDPRKLVQRALRHLKPGGYFEVQQLDYQLQCDDDSLSPSKPSALRDFIRFMEGGLAAYGGFDMRAIAALPALMRDAGFEDVRVRRHKCPIGTWARDKRLRMCGMFMRTAILDGLRGLSRRPLTALGWTPTQIEMFLIEVRKSVSDQEAHAYLNYDVVYGRKPEKAEAAEG
ncbi:Phosphoethanolamine N-methyltransferase [Podospora conica]|nr:Phosphoethanolamine N-methyltransferase [Schizothecium conicum]